MDGWGTNFDSVYHFKSSKIAPFRKMSKGYTGPKRKAVRDWEFDVDELQNMQDKIDTLCDGDLRCDDAYETTQFYRGILFIYVENLLTWDFSDSELYLIHVVNFFKSVVQLVINWLERAPKLFPYYYKSLVQPDLYLEKKQSCFSYGMV